MIRRLSQTHAACGSRLPALPPHATRGVAAARVPAQRPGLRCLFTSRRAACNTIRAQAQAAPSDTPKPPGLRQRIRGLLQLLPSAKCVSVLQLVSQLLRKYLWAVVIIYAVKDALQFLLHRVTHRLTNYAAEVIFKYPISDEVINAWWLVLDQEFLQQYPGYQAVMAALFLVAMPLNLLLSAIASASTVLLCAPAPHPSPATPTDSSPPPSSSTPSTSDPSSSEDTAVEVESEGVQGPAAPAPASASETAVASSTSSPATASPAADTTAAAPSTSSSTSTPAVPPADGGRQSSGSEASAAGTSAAASAASAAGGAVAAEGGAGGDTPSRSEAGPSSSSGTENGAPAEKQKRGWFAPLRRGWQEAAEPLPKVGGMLRRVWWTETVVSVIGLALQAGMMLFITVPWLLPIYLSAQLAGVTSVKLGDWGLKAIDSSSALMKGRKRVVFWPLLALILAAKLIDQVKVSAFAAMPQRFWAEAVEVPLAAYVLLQGLRVAVSRMQDLLPVGLYLHLLQEQEADRAATTTTAASS